MYTGDVWGVTLIVLGLIAATTAFQVLVSAVFGARVGAASRHVARSPFASIGTGLLTLGVGVVAAAVMGQIPGIGPGAAVLASIPLVLFALFGWTAASRVIGERLPSPADTPWRATMRGAIASGLFGIVVPVLGWFLVLPLVLAAGTGGLVLSFLRTPLQAEPRTAAA